MRLPRTPKWQNADQIWEHVSDKPMDRDVDRRRQGAKAALLSPVLRPVGPARRNGSNVPPQLDLSSILP